jgi:3-phosphoshikimate 1-carboxyvinyltransferase
MKVTINKSQARGMVAVPTSKSQTIRALMCAALARGESEIISPLESEDTNAAVNVLAKLGVTVRKEAGRWKVSGGKLRVPKEDLYCGESATTLRLLTAVCALIPGRHRLTGGPSLSRRPARPLVDALRRLGISGATEKKGTPPVIIEGGTLAGDATELPGEISSQFVSALLLIAPFAKQEISIRLTTPMKSRPYVLMTLWCLKQFGINVRSELDKFVVKRQRYTQAAIKIEGDWSSASYFLALGAVAGDITLQNMNTTSLQGDRVILDLIRNMGAKVKISGDAINVSTGELKAIDADLSDCIDLLPTMAVLAALASGTSHFTGIERARLKESDRVMAVSSGLRRLGVTVVEDKDRLNITGLKSAAPTEDDKEAAAENPADKADKKERKPAVIESFGDHRVAMAFATFGAAVGGVTINGAECVAKTFPEFWEVMKKGGVEMELGQ